MCWKVTAIGRQMVLGHLLRRRRDELKYFKSVAHQTGLAAELDRAFAELERCGKTADDLDVLVKQLHETGAADEGVAALASKLHDLHLLYAAYGAYIGQDRLDPHRRLQQVLTCVHESRRVRGAAVFVDGFYDFTDYERRFLAGVARVCERVEITLPLDPNSPLLNDAHAPSDDLSTFHPIEQTYRRLYEAFDEAKVAVAPPLVLRTPARFEKPALKHLEACLFARHPKPIRSHEGLTLVEAPDRRSEVDAAARHVQSLLADGLRLRDVAVLVRDLDDYHELIDASLHEHGLPYFVDRRRGAAHHPLLQFVRALLSVALHGWDHDAVMTLLKSGLAPLVDDTGPAERRDATTLEAADLLENYVLRHRIRGDAWADARPWTYRRDLLRRGDEDDDDAAIVAARDEARSMNAIRQFFVTPLGPFVQLVAKRDDPIPLRQIVIAMMRVFYDCKVPDTLARWMGRAEANHRLEERAEHAQVWNELTELLDQMVDLLGGEPVSPADFVEILESGLERFDLALTPPTVDQILVGSVDRTRTGRNVRATIVLGLNEGGFPRCPAESTIFRDSERRELAARDVDLDPDTHRRLFDERFFGYVAFTRASQRLCLTRPTSDDAGRPLAASSFWKQVRAIFPTIEPGQVPRDARRRPDCTGTPRQLVTSLLRWARRDETDRQPANPTWPALYQLLARHDHVASERSAIDVMRYRAWRALSYENSAAISPQIAAQLFSSPLSASVSRIESFAACPFKHFVGYGLRLRERDDEDVTALDLGNVYHGILENVVRAIVVNRQDFVSATPQFTREQIRACADRIGESIRDELMLSTARNKYLLQRAEETVGRVIDAQREVARRGRFKPWKTELTFGLPGDANVAENRLPALDLPTPTGRVVRLRGKIDRVDLIEGGTAVAVIDYKLSSNRLPLDRVYHGLSLQLLTYLLVLQSNGETLAGQKLTPAAAFYVQLLRKLEKKEHPDDATPPDDPRFHLKVKPRGLFDDRFLPALDELLDRGRSDVVNAHVKTDGTVSAASDCTDRDSFSALLRFVARRIGQLADQILGGDIGIEPYRIGMITPCPSCAFRSVCRFDPARQDYRHLEPVARQAVIDAAKAVGVRARGGTRHG